MSLYALPRVAIWLAVAAALYGPAAIAQPEVAADVAASVEGADQQPRPQALAASQSAARTPIMEAPLAQSLQPKDPAPRVDANGEPLGEPLGPGYPPPLTAQELRQQHDRDRADAARAAQLLAGLALAFALACAPLYLREPRLGPRRLAVVGGTAVTLATAGAFATQVSTWTTELGLAVAASSLSVGLGTLFLALLGLAGWRWISAGFRIDRAGRAAAPVTQIGEP